MRHLTLALVIVLAFMTRYGYTAVPGSRPSALESLDTAEVRKLYMEGEFDQAIGILEVWLREKTNYSHTDSVFVFKHLGVMYSADYESREKGKYYMLQLLNVEPTAKILDMYASDMIYMIFKNIQDEFEANRMKGRRLERPLASSSDTLAPRKTGHALLWWGATAVVVGAGVTAYFILPEAKTLPGTDYPVD